MQGTQRRGSRLKATCVDTGPTRTAKKQKLFVTKKKQGWTERPTVVSGEETNGVE